MLTVPSGTRDAYIAAGWTTNIFKGGIVEAPLVIVFADPNVKAICVANWDTDGDGEIDTAEAAAVTDIGTVFKDNTTITSFDEFRYFTGVTSIPNYAFQGCSSLVSIQIPSGLEEIQMYAFQGCSSLSSINLHHLRILSSGAFQDCSSLTSLSVSANALGSSVFSGCTNLRTITLSPNTWVSIYTGSLFSGCSSLTSIELPAATSGIAHDCFNGCSSLTSITLPAACTSVGRQAFKDCSSLRTITTYGNDLTFSDNVFNDACTSL